MRARHTLMRSFQLNAAISLNTAGKSQQAPFQSEASTAWLLSATGALHDSAAVYGRWSPVPRSCEWQQELSRARRRRVITLQSLIAADERESMNSIWHSSVGELINVPCVLFD
jgi:hypothetical protein